MTHQLAAALGGPPLSPGSGDLGVLALTFQHTSCVRGRPRLRVFHFLSAQEYNSGCRELLPALALRLASRLKSRVAAEFAALLDCRAGCRTASMPAAQIATKCDSINPRERWRRTTS